MGDDLLFESLVYWNMLELKDGVLGGSLLVAFALVRRKWDFLVGMGLCLG
jgi:hypothetical protein